MPPASFDSPWKSWRTTGRGPRRGSRYLLLTRFKCKAVSGLPKPIRCPCHQASTNRASVADELRGRLRLSNYNGDTIINCRRWRAGGCRGIPACGPAVAYECFAILPLVVSTDGSWCSSRPRRAIYHRRKGQRTDAAVIGVTDPSGWNRRPRSEVDCPFRPAACGRPLANAIVCITLGSSSWLSDQTSC